jgi:hypothetical protein
MARSKNSLTDVSPASGQLKSSFSNLERTQLDALKQTSGSLGYGAGNITGSVINSLQNLSYRDRSKLEIGGLYAEGLEKSGITRQNSAGLISSVVGNSIDNRKPFYRNTPKKELDLSVTSNRVPDPFQKSPTEEIEEKRASLVGEKDYNYEGLTFPLDLKENAHAFLELNLYTYKRPEAFEKGKFGDSVSHIYLPLPEDFNQEFSVEYGARDTGVLGAIATSGTGTKVLENFADRLAGGKISGDDVIGEVNVLRDIGTTAAYAGFQTLGGVSEVAGGLVGQTAGKIANPHPTVFFQGVNLRQYSFSWKMIPRNEDESEVIRKILKKIKKDCLPKKDGNFLKYPKLVEPKIKNGKFGKDYKKSLVQSISINYTGEGTSAFFVDGNPVSVILTLGFQEAELFLDEANDATSDGAEE